MSFYLQKRGSGPYHFRIRVPQDLQQWFHTPEIKRSLRTKNPTIAKSQCRLMASKAEHVFSQIRSGLLSESQIHQLVEKHFPSRKRKSSPLEKPKLLFPVVDGYVKEHLVLGKWTEKTRLEVEGILEVFKAIVGNVPLSAVDREVAVGFFEKVSRLPANMNKKREYRDKSVLEILDMDGVQPMSPTTVNKYVTRVSSLFVWCVRQGHMKWNPAEGLSVQRVVKEEEERKAYTKGDLKGLVHSLGSVGKGKPERFWVPLIGMYSGMRLNEICQLYLDDVKQVEGAWCFDINDEEDKRLKNVASRRLIPVHPELLKLGFVEYVDQVKSAGSPRLWTNLEKGRDGYGHLFSKWYQRHNRKHVTRDSKKVFHSFRHTVADTLKQKGVPEGVIAEILGHANGSITMGRYGKRYRPEVLLDALVKLDYEVKL